MPAANASASEGVSTMKRVPPDVAVELGFGRVGADVRERELTVAVVERCGRPRLPATEDPRDGRVLVVVVGGGHGELLQERGRIRAAILRFDIDELHLAGVAAG